jgi:hypothetical protein
MESGLPKQSDIHRRPIAGTHPGYKVNRPILVKYMMLKLYQITNFNAVVLFSAHRKESHTGEAHATLLFHQRTESTPRQLRTYNLSQFS